MLMFSKLVYFFATLISTAAVTSSEAKVLRSNGAHTSRVSRR
jgi:hypothetical protein